MLRDGATQNDANLVGFRVKMVMNCFGNTNSMQPMRRLSGAQFFSFGFCRGSAGFLFVPNVLPKRFLIAPLFCITYCLAMVQLPCMLLVNWAREARQSMLHFWGGKWLHFQASMQVSAPCSKKISGGPIKWLLLEKAPSGKVLREKKRKEKLCVHSLTN